jgi:hypothetical protein
MFSQLKSFFTKPEVLIITLSLCITTVISLVIGIGGYFWFGNFIGIFLTSFGAQVIIFAIVNTFLLRKDQIENVKLLNQQLESLSKFTVKLSCAYCKQFNVVPITLNQENRFECESCKQINGIKMQFYTTQVTTPLESVLMPAGNETIEFKVSSN